MAKVLNVNFDRDYYFDPTKRYAIDSQCNEYALENFRDMRLFYSESNLGQIEYWDKKQIQIGGIQPNLILGILMGAEFKPQNDKDPDITPGILTGTDPGKLPAPQTLLEDPLIRLFDKQIHQQQQDTARKLCPVPPFFWDISGRATIHGPVTTAQKLLGETIFLEMVTEQQQSMQIMDWICDVYIVLCRHFSEIADLHITEVHIGECSACMIDPKLIKQFVVPAASKIGKKLGPVHLHSCGPSTNHLKAFSKIAKLKSIDLGGETSVKKARKILGKDFPISISPLPVDMSAESTEPILNWAKQIVEENNSGNLEFVYHLEADYNIDTIYALTDFVKRLK